MTKVFKGSLYILNLLCGLVPCEHKYPFPDTDSNRNDLGQFDRDAGSSNEVQEVWNGNGKDGNGTFENDPLVVSTKSGKMKGYLMRAVGGRKVRAFEGIPYAEPPMQELRFKAPLPVKPWTGLLQANLKGPKCLQYNDIKLLRVIGSENCLYLNIYVRQPKVKKYPPKKYPVLIYIHGGGFLTGSGNDFGPAYLLTRDIILVTINYRLGILGFMSIGDTTSTGNFGLKDQAEAINWVYENIENFMGDPERITLLGHGSGGSSVHFQMMSFRARGKFIGGISISGTAFNQWALHTKDQAVNLTKTFAKSLHCPVHGGTEDTVLCLRKIRGFDLVKRQIAYLDTWPAPLSLFRPVIEEEYQEGEPFLTETPEEAYRKGTVDRIPWICGLAEDEGYTFLLSHVALGTFANLRKNWNQNAPDFLNYNDLPVDQDEITRRVNWLYFRHVNPQSAPLKVYSDALGARMVHTGIHKGLQAHSQFAETYAFMFGYNGKYNLARTAGIKSNDWAVGHGEILGYILNSTNTYSGFKRTDSELVLSKILVNLIYNFADKQVPDLTTSSGEDFHVWNRITDPRNMSFLHIDTKIKMIQEPYLQQTLYWESLGLPDSLPLANFSNEVENLLEKDPDSKGFVSTDVSRQNESSVTPEFKPPAVGFQENYFALYNNVSFDNKTTPVEKENELAMSKVTTDQVSITSTSPSPPSTTATAKTSTTTTSKPSTTTTTFKWFAQDFPLPNVTVAKRQQVSSTPIPTPAATTTMAITERPSPIPPGAVVGNLIDTVLRRYPFVNTFGNSSSRGISVPIVGDQDPHGNFVTRSNINMTVAYLKQFRDNRNIEQDEDETMIMESNSPGVF